MMGLWKSPKAPTWQDLENNIGDLFDECYERLKLQHVEALFVPAPFIPYGSNLDKVVQDIIEGRRKA